MRTLLLFLVFLWPGGPAQADTAITPSDVFAQAVQIEKEINILKAHFEIAEEKPAPPVSADLTPRHVWQKTYNILIKINIFRTRHRLPVNTLNSLEPVLELDPVLNYEQIQRILTEIQILKLRLGIAATVTPPESFVGKQPLDVYNKLHWISWQWDILNREEIGPSTVFAEVMRIFQDINALLYAQAVEDSSYPPPKVAEATPADSLAAAFELIEEVQRLQRGASLARTDFSVFRAQGAVLPSDVLNMVGLVLAELQVLKAHQGLNHALTPPATVYQNKSVADVQQLLRWATRKLQLVKNL